MIKFDIKKLKVKEIWIKSVSAALGGTLTVLDPVRSTADREVFTKIRIPVHIARRFQKLYEIRTYMKPVLGAVVTYDNRVVAIERHVLAGLAKVEEIGLDGQLHRWKSIAQNRIENDLPNMVNGSGWHTDGMFIYRFSDAAAATASPVSTDGRFKQVRAETIAFEQLSSTNPLTVQPRVAVGYFSPSGKVAMSPPIWKSLSQIGYRRMDHVGEEDDTVDVGNIDPDVFNKVDEYLCVNLSFALAAGRRLQDVFGYEALQPLNLPELMLRHRTVNLPKLPASVKATFDVGIPFTHAMAWLIGLQARTNTLESYMVVRSLLRYLTTRGLYQKNAFKTSSLFINDADLTNLPLLNLTELLAQET